MGKIKNILVTGGVGFIGSHLVEQLVEKKYHVSVPFLTIKPHSYFATQKLDQKSHVEKCDITDKKSLHQLLQKQHIDFIFHLAAETIVTESYDDPWNTFNTNIMGTVNLLEEVRTNNIIQGIIVASSDKAYGKSNTSYNEASPLRGDHPYDVSKSAADLISLAYHKTYDVPVIVTRFANVYGEGDMHLDRLIPGVCSSIHNQKKLVVRSDGTFVRDYIYVKDVVDAYMFLYENFEKNNGEAFNVSSDDSFSVIDLIAEAERILERKIPYRIARTMKNEIPYQHLNDSKIRSLGWRSRFRFSDIIERIFLWYTQNL